MVPPIRLREILPNTPWPAHLVELICGDPVRDVKISVEEVAASLCHAALVEIGFVPTFINVEPTTIPGMPERERIPLLTKAIPSNLKNSAAGVFTLSYRGIKEERVVNEGPGVGAEAGDENVDEFRFNFTIPAEVIIIAQNSKVSIYGTVKREGEWTVPASLHFEISVHDTFHIQPTQPSPSANKIFCEARSGRDWLNFIHIRGPIFSELIKRNFGLQLLTLVDGIPFEPALNLLPAEILTRMFKYLDIRTILNLSEVSWYMYSVTDNEFFWLALIDRDYPKHSKDVRTKLSNPPPVVASPSDHPTPVPVTAYTEYRRLYMSDLAARPRRFVSSWDFFPPRPIPPRFNRSMFMFRQFHF